MGLLLIYMGLLISQLLEESYGPSQVLRKRFLALPCLEPAKQARHGSGILTNKHQVGYLLMSCLWLTHLPLSSCSSDIADCKHLLQVWPTLDLFASPPGLGKSFLLCFLQLSSTSNLLPVY